MKVDRSFFGTSVMPEISISKKQIEEFAMSSVNRGVTVTGVQKKLSLGLSGGRNARLTLIDYPTGYILKPQTEEYANLPEAEDIVMDISALAGVKTVPHGLIEIDSQYAYITKRIDRLRTKTGMVKRAMEDFCQLSGRMTEDKYRGSYEKCVDIINKYSSRGGLDKTEFFLRIIVSYLTGNSDMHLKNFSLVETAPESRVFVLAEAYDMLPVNIILPEDTDELALTLNGKKSNFRRQDFMDLSKKCDIPEKAANRIIDRTVNLMPKYEAAINCSELPDVMKTRLIELMQVRAEILKG